MSMSEPSPHAGSRLPLPSLSSLWAALVPLALLAAIDRVLITPNDFWWHIRVGVLILQRHTIPTRDLFTFTRGGAPWTYQAWLAEVILYLLYATGGAPLVILGHALTITAGYTAALVGPARTHGTRAAALAALLAAALSLWNWNVRPQTFSFLFFGLLVALVERHRRRGDRSLWLAVPLFALWGNVHGGFVFGLGYLWAHLFGWAWERRQGWGEPLAAVGVSTLAVGLSPWGPWGMVRYVLGFLHSPVTVQGNVEFMPLTVRQPDGMLFVASLLLLLVLYARAGQGPRPGHALPLLLFALGSLWSRRVLSWYGFVLLPVLAEAIAAVWRQRPRHTPSLPATLLIVLLLLGDVLSLPWWRGVLPDGIVPSAYLAPTTPVAATAYLCEHAPEAARVYQHQVFASYQIWACPRLPVFIDTRLELYPTAQWEDYFAIEQGRFDWEEVAGKYGITHLFLSTYYQPQAIRAARASPRWREVYADDVAVIFARVARP